MPNFAKDGMPSEYIKKLEDVVNLTKGKGHVDDTVVSKFRQIYSDLRNLQNENKVRYNKSEILFEYGLYLNIGNDAQRKKSQREILFAYVEDLLTYNVEVANTLRPLIYIKKHNLYNPNYIKKVQNTVKKMKSRDDVPDRPSPVIKAVDEIKSEYYTVPTVREINKAVKENIDEELEELYISNKEDLGKYTKAALSYERVNKGALYISIIWCSSIIIDVLLFSSDLILGTYIIVTIATGIIIISTITFTEYKIIEIKTKCKYDEINVVFVYLSEGHKLLSDYLENDNILDKEDGITELRKGFRIIKKWTYGNIPFIVNKYGTELNILKAYTKTTPSYSYDKNQVTKLIEIVSHIRLFLSTSNIENLKNVTAQIQKLPDNNSNNKMITSSEISTLFTKILSYTVGQVAISILLSIILIYSGFYLYANISLGQTLKVFMTANPSTIPNDIVKVSLGLLVLFQVKYK